MPFPYSPRSDILDFISGYCAFTHKAGIHAKAILNNPSTYEILKPEDFGLTRYVSIGYVKFHCYRKIFSFLAVIG